MNANALALTDTSDLFEYPVSTRERLESHYFLTFHYRRWLLSDFRNLADPEVRAIGFDLFCFAQDHAPVGTLPTDPRLLAKLAGIGLDQWEQICRRVPSPLYNWSRCICDNGEVRLYHPVILEMVENALGLRKDHAERREADRERKRLKQLRDQMVRAGASSGMADSDDFVLRLDQYLNDHFPDKQRRTPLVRSAMEEIEVARYGEDHE